MIRLENCLCCKAASLNGLVFYQRGCPLCRRPQTATYLPLSLSLFVRVWFMVVSTVVGTLNVPPLVMCTRRSNGMCWKTKIYVLRVVAEYPRSTSSRLTWCVLRDELRGN